MALEGRTFQIWHLLDIALIYSDMSSSCPYSKRTLTCPIITNNYVINRQYPCSYSLYPIVASGNMIFDYLIILAQIILGPKDKYSVTPK